MNKVPLTVSGAEKLRAELFELKTVVRPRIINAIAEAREHGELKENAEYHAAREQQSFAEGRIAEIEGKLSNAQVIDVTQINAGGKVIFGATVEIEDIASGAKADRVGLSEVLKYIRKGDTLVVWRLDRLGRSLRHLIDTINQINDQHQIPKFNS